MADLAEKKREARRRKILQNSENRMNRLLGKELSNERESDSPVSTDDSERTTPSPTEANISPVEEQTPQINSNHVSSEEKRTATVQPRPPLSSMRGSTTSNSTRSANVSPTKQKLHSSEDTKNLLQILENMRLVSCVVVAVFIRWVLSSGYGIFYFQTIFLPFILLETGLYSFHYTYMKDVALPHSNSMMSGALMLCGIKQDLVAVYNRAMGYVTAVSEDFALYFFTFIICNAVMA